MPNEPSPEQRLREKLRQASREVAFRDLRDTLVEITEELDRAIRNPQPYPLAWVRLPDLFNRLTASKNAALSYDEGNVDDSPVIRAWETFASVTSQSAKLSANLRDMTRPGFPLDEVALERLEAITILLWGLLPDLLEIVRRAPR